MYTWMYRKLSLEILNKTYKPDDSQAHSGGIRDIFMISKWIGEC